MHESDGETFIGFDLVSLKLKIELQCEGLCLVFFFSTGVCVRTRVRDHNETVAANKPRRCWQQHRILKSTITFITPGGLEIIAGQLLCSGF